MSLSKILEQIKVLQPISEEDLSNGPRETYSGREGRKRNAMTQIVDLKERYVDELRLSSVFIMVAGSAKEQFAEVAKTEFKCFTADPEGFYKDLTNRLPPQVWAQKTPPANLFDIMGRHLEDKANEMKIIGYPQLIMKAKYFRSIENKEDFVSLVKEAINEQVGSEITGLHVIRAIANDAITANHASKLTPIILTTDDEKLALDLRCTLGRIGSRAFLVAAGKGAKTVRSTEGAFTVKDVDKESVENILTNIRKLCR
jgi:hypothetical protein